MCMERRQHGGIGFADAIYWADEPSKQNLGAGHGEKVGQASLTVMAFLWELGRSPMDNLRFPSLTKVC